MPEYVYRTDAGDDIMTEIIYLGWKPPCDESFLFTIICFISLQILSSTAIV